MLSAVDQLGPGTEHETKVGQSLNDLKDLAFGSATHHSPLRAREKYSKERSEQVDKREEKHREREKGREKEREKERGRERERDV